nr:TonB-dependent receptor [Sphingomonas sp. SORGH_AS_0870]
MSASYDFTDVVTMSAGVYNLFDKAPPRVSTGGVFNTFPDTYDILGRTIGFSLTAHL